MPTDLQAPVPQQSSVAASAPNAGGSKWLAAILLVLIFCPLWHIHIFNRRIPPTYSDLVQRWVGARAALAGKDPYSTEVLRDILAAEYDHYPPRPHDQGVARQGFLYPAHIVLLLAPIAHFSWEAARTVFLATSLALLLLSVLMYLRTFHPSITRTQITIITVLAIINWPVVWGARFQQPTLLVAALIFLACVCLRRNWPILAAILLAIATVKPQIAAPIIAWLILWSLFHRAWRFFAAFAITLSLLLLETERIVPGWFGNWRASLQGYRQVTDTDLPLQNFLGHWAGLILTLFLVAAGIFALWRSRKSDISSSNWSVSLSLVLALTVVLIPTHFTLVYNHILLFPACVTLILASPADPYSKFARQIALALLGTMFALPVISVSIETLWKPYPVVDGLPFLTNSILPPAVALAVLCQMLRKGTLVPSVRRAEGDFA
ncbi:MAG: glycosyltransferase family 87 protein [Terriglobia bacterium]|nr:glycosyltransferase family 87 protein [Terriglobia bacterium]